ncbi:MAG: C_GCAxxG_C_C family protein [Paludibacteraceae bacterium]|nr:C_GCAxxG_C_C family protein [Paludibacteraceae bacterium]
MIEIDIEERRNRAVAYFMEGYNCSQSVFMTYTDFVGVDIELAKKLSAPFGGGMGRMGEVCGACSSMFLIAGIKYPFVNPNNHEAKIKTYEIVQHLANQFKQEFGTIICAELLNIEQMFQDSTPSDSNSKFYAERPCARFVAKATEIIGREIMTKTT